MVGGKGVGIAVKTHGAEYLKLALLVGVHVENGNEGGILLRTGQHNDFAVHDGDRLGTDNVLEVVATLIDISGETTYAAHRVGIANQQIDCTVGTVNDHESLQARQVAYFGGDDVQRGSAERATNGGNGLSLGSGSLRSRPVLSHNTADKEHHANEYCN